jgi:hypothetical protein
MAFLSIGFLYYPSMSRPPGQAELIGLAREKAQQAESVA